MLCVISPATHTASQTSTNSTNSIKTCFLTGRELDEIVFAWNNHRIRPVHNSRSPHGRPSIMYAVSHLYGATDHLHPVCLEKVQVCLEECVFKDFPCDEDTFNVCVDLMSEHDLNHTNDVFAAVDLYITLRVLIKSELERHI